MSMLITTTVDNEVEGLRVSDGLETKIMPTQNAFQKARAVEDMIKSYLTLWVQIRDGSTAAEARLYVESNVTRVQ